MKKVNEQINGLIAQFYDFRTTSISGDFPTDERIFSSNPAPEPSFSLLADIREIMYAAAQKERERIYRLVWRYAAAAAVIIFVFGVSISLLHRPAQQIQTQTYASNSFWHDSLSPIEITIDAQFRQLESGESDSRLLILEHIMSPEMSTITDITAELNDSDQTFWKG